MNKEYPYSVGKIYSNSNEHEGLWKVTDICFVAALKTRGIEPVDIDSTDVNKFAFYFIFDNRLQMIMDEYYGRRMPVDAFSLFQAFKQVKTTIYGNSYVPNKARSEGTT